MLRVQLLGQFDVRVDDKRVLITSRAGQSLLAYLLLTTHATHRREKLAGLLWPDTTDENARKNLRQELWRIRKALTASQVSATEYILADELTIAFNSETSYWLDVAQLERDLSSGASLDERIQQAALYQGELLPGFYDEWMVLERERVQALYERQMQQLLMQLIAEGRWTPTLEWSEHWIALGHTPEPAYRALMIAYAALGDPAKVAATFDRGVAALEKELGVEPSAETRSLHDQLLRGEVVKQVNLSAAQVAPMPSHPHDELPAPGAPPFKGLQYFDEDDADLFFGREQLTARLIGRLRESDFVAVVVGASGSGKSSAVRAGLIPALKTGAPLADGLLPPAGSTAWRYEIMTPTAHPLEALAIALTRRTESVTAAATLMDDLMRDARSLRFFTRRSLAADPNASHLLLIVDQFEELFTLCHDEFEREAFIDNLLSALSPSPSQGEGRGEGQLTLILTIRADFYAHLAQYPELRDAVAQQQEYIGPLTVEELRRAIEEPARRGAWQFEQGLVDLMLRDVGDEPGALPLLSHALLETWLRRSGRTLTLKGYADAGGVRGAIAFTAETVYQQLSPEQQNMARHIFLRLTELGEGTEDTRRRATIHELISQPGQAAMLHAVLNVLANARLITLGADSAEVAHEAVIREWPRLYEWLNDDREGLQLHRHVTDAAHEWELLDRDPGALYRGARLGQASEWAATNEQRINELEHAFLNASVDQERREEQERETQRQRELNAAQELAETRRRANTQLRRRARYLTGAFVLAIVLAGFALFFGEQARQNAIQAQYNAVSAQASEKQAQSEQRISTSRELAAAAISSLDEDPERSILLTLQAESTVDTIEAENALHRSILASRVVLALHHDGPVWSVIFSPDGKRIATASQDKTAKIWDARTGQLLLTLIGHTDSVNSVAYSPDGKRVATASDDHTAKVWDAETGKELLALSGHTDQVRRLAFSPDGTRLATTSVDKTARVWDALTGRELLTFSGHGDDVFDVAFNPDGKRIATSGQDGNVRIWDATSGKELLTLPVEDNQQLRGVAFSPDGARVAVTSFGDDFVKMWDATTGKVLLSGKMGHTDFLCDIAFSPDGKLAATGGNGQKVNVWDSTTGQVLVSLSGHTSNINGVAFSPDGMRLATAGWDHTARVWDITPAKEALFIPFANSVTSGWSGRLSYSPDGLRILTDYTDSNARIWDAVSGTELFQFSGSNSNAWNASYSYDGKLAATGNEDGTINVWDAQTGKLLTTLVGHTDGILQTAFSPDRTRLASASSDGTAIIFDLADGTEFFTLNRLTDGNSASTVAYSPNGKQLLTGYFGGSGFIWDTSTGEKLFNVSLPTGIDGETVNSAVYSPDGKRVALAGYLGTIRIWDASTGKELLNLRGHTGSVNQITFSSGGKLLASASSDGTARIWDTTSGVNLLTLPVESKGVGGVSFSPDGERLAVGSGSGISIFLLPIQDVIALAKSRLTRTLTLEECQKYLHVEQCSAP